MTAKHNNCSITACCVSEEVQCVLNVHYVYFTWVYRDMILMCDMFVSSSSFKRCLSDLQTLGDFESVWMPKKELMKV